MIIRILNGPVAPDEGSAVAQAIALAHGSFGRFAEKMHIHVISVMQVDHMFRAVIKVELEPALKKSEDEKPEQKDEKDDLKLEEDLEEEPEEEHEEKPEAKQKPKEELHSELATMAAILPDNDLSLTEQELEKLFFTEYTPATPADPTMHIYMLEEHAPRYYDPKYYMDHPDYTFHFITHGSPWEAATTHELTPDMDLYESAHPEVAELMEAEKRYQLQLQNDLEQKRILEKRKRLVQELTDDI